MSLELFALKLLIKTGLAEKLEIVNRRAAGNAAWLRYYSNSVLAGPGENMRLLKKLLETRAAGSGYSPIDLTFGAPELSPEWTEGFAELANEALTETHVADESSSLAKYPPPLGHPRLKSLLAEKLFNEQGLAYHPDTEMLVTCGASQALSAALNALVSPRDKVVLLDPSYYMYSYMCKLLQARIEWVPTTLDHGYVEIDERDLDRAMRGAKVMILNSPSNPTGCVLARETLERIARAANRHDVILLSDDVYEYFLYEGEFASIASIPEVRERTLVVNSFSKSYRMPAYRVGYIYGPEPLLQAVTMEQVIQSPFVPTLVQRLAIVALERQQNIAERVQKEYLPKRKIVVDACRDAGLPIPPPTGAFYAWIPVDSLGIDGHQLVMRLAESKNVLCMPGSDFGPSGKNFVRISFGGSVKDLLDGMGRFVDFVLDQASPGQQVRVNKLAS